MPNVTAGLALPPPCCTHRALHRTLQRRGIPHTRHSCGCASVPPDPAASIFAARDRTNSAGALWSRTNPDERGWDNLTMGKACRGMGYRLSANSEELSALLKNGPPLGSCECRKSCLFRRNHTKAARSRGAAAAWPLAARIGVDRPRSTCPQLAAAPANFGLEAGKCNKDRRSTSITVSSPAECACPMRRNPASVNSIIPSLWKMKSRPGSSTSRSIGEDTGTRDGAFDASLAGLEWSRVDRRVSASS
jgi:hypothetical protein